MYGSGGLDNPSGPALCLLPRDGAWQQTFQSSANKGDNIPLSNRLLPPIHHISYLFFYLGFSVIILSLLSVYRIFLFKHNLYRHSENAIRAF